MKKYAIILLNLLVAPLAAFAIDIGQLAPSFELNSFSGNKFSLNDYKDKTVVLEWTNPGCPFVKKHYENSNMQKLQTSSRAKGIVWVSINSTTHNHQDHLTKESAEKIAKDWNTDLNFMLDDTEGKVGKLYGAKSTPHMFILDKGKLIYKGAIDDNDDVFETKTNKNYVTDALSEISQKKPITLAETKPYGCSVKY